MIATMTFEEKLDLLAVRTAEMEKATDRSLAAHELRMAALELARPETERQIAEIRNSIKELKAIAFSHEDRIGHLEKKAS